MKAEVYITLGDKEWGSETVDYENGDTYGKAIKRLNKRFRKTHSGDPLDTEKEFLSTLDPDFCIRYRRI
ncbi:MAG: hypothetical protein GXP04_12210 [Alphaproteobacteria bacterium]|nr:hypothetical protein [Alphaproteobacteria bacterium]